MDLVLTAGTIVIKSGGAGRVSLPVGVWGESPTRETIT